MINSEQELGPGTLQSVLTEMSRAKIPELTELSRAKIRPYREVSIGFPGNRKICLTS